MADQTAPSPKLLDLLVCPVTRAPLSHDKDHAWLVSEQAKLVYAIEGGIPDLNPEGARPLT